MSCQKSEINERYFPVYYEVIISNNHPMEVRLRYLNKLEILSVQKSNKISNKSISYLILCYEKLSQSNDKNNKIVFSEVQKILLKLGYTKNRIKKEKIFYTQDSWLKEEILRRSQTALEITSSPQWDKRIYGRWIRHEELTIKQFIFFPDTTFQYNSATNPKIMIPPQILNQNHEQVITEYLDKKGSYHISKNTNNLELIYTEGNIKKSFKYNISEDILTIENEEYFRN